MQNNIYSHIRPQSMGGNNNSCANRKVCHKGSIKKNKGAQPSFGCASKKEKKRMNILVASFAICGGAFLFSKTKTCEKMYEKLLNNNLGKALKLTAKNADDLAEHSEETFGAISEKLLEVVVDNMKVFGKTSKKKQAKLEKKFYQVSADIFQTGVGMVKKTVCHTPK